MKKYTRLTRTHPLRIIAKAYKVRGIHLGGCISGRMAGFKGAMRYSAHAHCHKHHKSAWLKYNRWYRYICVKSSHIEKLMYENGKPTHLFWHEVSHIYHPSRTQQQCDDWADEQLKVYA